MKNHIYTLVAVVLLLALASCSNTQSLSSYEDDIYYSPKSELAQAQVEDEYVDIDDRDYSYLDESSTSGSKSMEAGEYYDPEYKEDLAEEQKRTAVNSYGNRYEDDDFYYSNRYRRFNSRVNVGFGYYDPYFSYGNWYSYDPFFPRPSYWHPYNQPGFNYGWSSRWGWNYSYSAWGPGWGFNYAWGQPFGYSPYYGGGFASAYYCPTAFNGGYNANDFYGNRGNSLYAGQFTPYGGATAGNSSEVARGVRSLGAAEIVHSGKEDYRQRMEQRPATSSARQGQQQATGARDVSPSSTEYPVGTRPGNATEERPQSVQRDEAPSYVRPSSTNDTRPSSTTRPQETPSIIERPRQEVRPQNQTPPLKEESRSGGLFNRGGSDRNSGNRRGTMNTTPTSRPSSTRSTQPSRSSGSSTRSKSSSRSSSGSRSNSSTRGNRR